MQVELSRLDKPISVLLMLLSAALGSSALCPVRVLSFCVS